MKTKYQISLSVINKVIKMSARKLDNTTFAPSFIISISLFKADGKTFLVVNFLETSQAYPDRNRTRWQGFLIVGEYDIVRRKYHIFLDYKNLHFQ